MRVSQLSTGRTGVALTVLLPAVMSAGCANYVTTRVTAFADWDRGAWDTSRTYDFIRGSAQQDSIEQRTYEELVADGLASLGFRRTRAAQARYQVGLRYGLTEVTGVVQQPVGFYGDSFWGPWTGWGGWGPGWAVFGAPAYVTRTYLVHVNTLEIRITERATGKEVYKVTARNAGETSALPQAMPYLVQAALADFPLRNGTTREVRIRYQGRTAVQNETPLARFAALGGSAAAGAPNAASAASGATAR